MPDAAYRIAANLVASRANPMEPSRIPNDDVLRPVTEAIPEHR
jgi:hypothetical protein